MSGKTLPLILLALLALLCSCTQAATPISRLLEIIWPDDQAQRQFYLETLQQALPESGDWPDLQRANADFTWWQE